MTDSASETLQIPPTNRQKSQRKQWQRGKNYEDSSLFTTNFLFCFYFPYICRVTPLVEDDVPVPSANDRSEVTVEQLRAKWSPLFNEYLRQLDTYQHSMYLLSFLTSSFIVFFFK